MIVICNKVRLKIGLSLLLYCETVYIITGYLITLDIYFVKRQCLTDKYHFLPVSYLLPISIFRVLKLDDTNRTTFVVPKWLSVKEKYIIQAFSKRAFKSSPSYSKNILKRYSHYTISLLIIWLFKKSRI